MRWLPIKYKKTIRSTHFKDGDEVIDVGVIGYLDRSIHRPILFLTEMNYCTV